MTERDMITMMMDTLQGVYYEKIVGYMLVSFVDLVFAGERIEVGLKQGKFDYVASTNSGNRRPVMNGVKKREVEAHVMATVPTWSNLASPL